MLPATPKQTGLHAPVTVTSLCHLTVTELCYSVCDSLVALFTLSLFAFNFSGNSLKYLAVSHFL